MYYFYAYVFINIVTLIYLIKTYDKRQTQQKWYEKETSAYQYYFLSVLVILKIIALFPAYIWYVAYWYFRGWKENKGEGLEVAISCIVALSFTCSLLGIRIVW